MGHPKGKDYIICRQKQPNEKVLWKLAGRERIYNITYPTKPNGKPLPHKVVVR
jgi:hypothetical protein